MTTWPTGKQSTLRRLQQLWRSLRIPLALLTLAILLGWLLVLAFQLGNSLLTLVGKAIVGTDPREVGRFLARSAAIGFLVMTLIQVTRNLLRIRGWFQRAAVNRWLLRGIEQLSQAYAREREESDGQPEPPPWEQNDPEWEELDSTAPVRTLQKAEHLEEVRRIGEEATRRLVWLAVTHDDKLLFGLPIEQLSGQISAAADRVLEDPRGSELLLLGLAGKAGVDTAWRYPLRWRLTRDREDDSRTEADFLEARSALTHHIQRNIDGLQISTGMRWRHLLRWTAMILAFLIAAALGVAQAGSSESELPTSDWQAFGEGLLGSMLTALAAGFLATFFRDLVAVIEKHR